MAKPPAGDSGGDDEAVDPRVAYQQQAQAMAMELLRTAELAHKLKWDTFDFKVDVFDPMIDDFGGLLQAGDRVNREALSMVLAQGLDRHFTLEARYRLIEEIGRRFASEVLLDVREQGRTAMRALHQLQIGGRSIGLVLELYPRHLITRLQERQQLYAAEARDRSIDDDKLIEALIDGKAEASAVGSGDKSLAMIEKVFMPADDRTPPKPVLLGLVAEAAKHPGVRAARLLSALLFDESDEDVVGAIRRAIASMPPARDVVENHIAFHDPDAATRRRLFAVLVDLKTKNILPLMLEDAFAIGPWTEKGDVDHAKVLAADIVRLGDSRVVPMIVHIMSIRPPTKAIRAALVEGLSAGPWKDDLERALKAHDEGKPVVVHRELDYETFIQKYAVLAGKMDQAAAQAEVARVSRLYQECYHEELDWRTPKQVQEQVGPRERELLKKLVAETQQQLGRLAGHPQVAALEAEFRSRWMTTPQNDITGRIPLAIILDERAERDPDHARAEREAEADALYATSLRQHEGKLDDEAKFSLRAALQLVPDHVFAKEALARIEKGGGVPGIDEGAQPEAVAPRIILPE